MITALERMSEMIAKRTPVVTRFNMNQPMLEFIKKNFCIESSTPYIGAGAGMFWGTALYEVEYLANGFIEAEFDNGTRQIIDMRKK